MRRLEDIPKKPFFTVPPDYFEKLPARIQSRIAEKQRLPVYSVAGRFALRYALPVLLIVAAVVLYRGSNPDPANILASVETDRLVVYLDDTGMTTEEMIEALELSPEEIEAFEAEVYALTFGDVD